MHSSAPRHDAHFAAGRLAGRTALVTGATRGIGRTIAEWLAGAGASLYVSGTAAADVEATVAALRTTGVDVDGSAADLSIPAAAHELGRRALERAGRIDILVNNAGMSTRAQSWTVSDADWEYQLNVNLRAPFILGQYATRDMLARGEGGRIVNISTVGAQHAFRDAAAYNAAKSGIEALTRQHATELGPYGITVNAVAPGAVMDRPAAADEPELRRRYASIIPVGRVGRSEDVAAAVLFFCLPEAGWITGQVLTVDGGQTAYFADGAHLPPRDRAPMSGRLRIGFAGAGTIARDRHVAGLRAIPGVELTAVANRSEASSRAAADEFGFERIARDWQALVDDPALDAIVVGTWPYLHAEITEAALAAGKHVLSQARMALNAAEARRMVEAARAHPALTTLLVPASHTYWVDATLRRLLDEDAIGTPRTMVGAWNEPDVNDPGEWWRHQRRYSGHNIQGMGPLYEVFLRWVGAADAVTARTDLYESRKPGPDGDIDADNPDHVSMLIEFPRGLAASIEVSSHSAAHAPSQVTIVGTDGALRVDLRARSLERRSPGHGGAWALVAIDPADIEAWQVEEEFVGAIRGEREVRRNPFEVGLEYMTFSDAVIELAASGRRVTIDRKGAR